jgi:hypothetical protein
MLARAGVPVRINPIRRYCNVRAHRNPVNAVQA